MHCPFLVWDITPQCLYLLPSWSLLQSRNCREIIFPWFPTDLVRFSMDHFPKALCTPDLIFFFSLFLSRMEFLFPFYSHYLCWLHLCSPFHNEPCRLSRFHALLHSVNPLHTTMAPLQSPFLSLWSWTKHLYLVEPRKSHQTFRGCSKWAWVSHISHVTPVSLVPSSHPITLSLSGSPFLVQSMLTLVSGSNMDFWPVLYRNVHLVLPLGIQWCKEMGYKYRLFRNWAEISFVGYQKMLYFLFPFILPPH